MMCLAGLIGKSKKDPGEAETFKDKMVRIRRFFKSSMKKPCESADMRYDDSKDTDG